MEQQIRFITAGDRLSLEGIPALEGRSGRIDKEGMAFIYGAGHMLYIANARTGKVRQFATEGGQLLVSDSEIDYAAIAAACEHGLHNAERKVIRYASIERWGDFDEGLCAISWMLYPDGRYFADSDGYGMEDCDEEIAYAVINRDLEIVAPFRPMRRADDYLNATKLITQKENAL